MAQHTIEQDDYADFEKSWMLVGRYLSAWAFMEDKLDGAIQKGLALNELQGAIVCANVGFTSKCHILQTLVGLGKTRTKGKRDNDEKFFEKLKNLASDRNMIAHSQFFPGKSKSGKFVVSFIMISAKGYFSIPKPKWTEAIFESNTEHLFQTAKRLREFGNSLSHRRIVAALMRPTPSAPTLGLLGLGGLTSLSHQPPIGLLSDTLPSTDRKSPQTPQDSEE